MTAGSCTHEPAATVGSGLPVTRRREPVAVHGLLERATLAPAEPFEVGDFLESRDRADAHHRPRTAPDPPAAGAQDRRHAGRGWAACAHHHPRRSALLKALARAFRYQRMLDEGRYASISEMAAAEKLDRGYLGRLLQLTLLAPDIVEAIVEGRQKEGVTLQGLLEPLPVEWAQQRIRYR